MSEAGTPQSAATQPVLHTSYVAIAATVATVLTKSVLHPLDTIKCRLQSSAASSWRGVWRSYAGQWGPAYLYGGLPIKLAFYMPYQAVYMTSYSTAKRALTPEDASRESRTAFLARTIAAAATAEITSCFARVPMETVKMRIQASAIPNTAAALRQMRAHGFVACARLALPQTMLHDVPYSAIQWILYESFRPWTQTALQHARLDGASGDGATHTKGYLGSFARTFLSGGFSALIASTVTVPLDAIRTRVVVATSADPSATIRSVVRDTYRLGGAKIFFRGAGTRVLWVTANMALYFPLYEAFKIALLGVQIRREAAASA